tara:strand:+ start:665 stop:859 length:195 start_codon:yes stop_codon:yes gene_type:complete
MASGASNGAKKVKIFNDGVLDGVNVAKTPRQKAKSDVMKSIKKLTKEGKHTDAKALYDEQFPRA